jgi:putative MATE family efflux protein
MEKSMTSGNPAKLIFLFAVPLIIGNVFQQLYMFVDTLIVGRTIGINALAAVGSTGSVMFFMMGFVIGTTAGFAIVTGHRYGAGDRAGIKRSVAACTVLGVILSATLTAVGVLGAENALVLMQTPPEILEDAKTFISIILGGMATTTFINMMSNIIRALGDSRTPLFFLIFGSIVNVILEFAFILGLGMGVAGAAWATVIAQLLGGILSLLYIKRHLPILHISWSDIKAVTKKDLWEHIRVGLPMGFQASIIAIGAVLLQVALNALGPSAIAAFAAAQKVEMIALMPMMSFGMAMAAYTAQNFGAGNIARIQKGVRQCIMMSVSFSLVMALVNWFFGAPMVRWFVGSEAEHVVSLAREYLVITGCCYWILSLLFIYRYTLQGMGKSAVPTFAGVMELIMRSAAAMMVMQGILQFTGICIASPMAWLGSMVPLLIAYYCGMRRLRVKA